MLRQQTMFHQKKKKTLDLAADRRHNGLVGLIERKRGLAP